MSRVVVVTGASSGVGRATVRAFAARGDSLGLIARGKDGLDATLKECEAAGVRAVAVECDVADAAALERAADKIERSLGPIAVWINNAVASVIAPFTEVTMDEFKRETEITYLGQVYGTRSALRRMLPRDRGVIVQVGSALAHRGTPLHAAHCGAKYAMRGFTEALRAELFHARSRVRLTQVHLPALNTPLFDVAENRMPLRPQPIAPIFQPEVAADAILWSAAHPRRREVWVGGSTVATALANRVASGALDRLLGRAGVALQQRPEPEEIPHLSNLWEPLPGDRGAHGDFDRRARSRSVQWWVDARRGRIAAAAALTAGAAWLARRRRSA